MARFRVFGRPFPPNRDVAMTATVTLEMPIEHEGLLRRTLALAEELHQLALSAPDGTVFDACEAAVVRGDFVAGGFAGQVGVAEGVTVAQFFDQLQAAMHDFGIGNQRRMTRKCAMRWPRTEPR